MKKAIFLLGVALCLAGNAHAAGIETFFAGLAEPQAPVAAPKRAKARGEASLKALCKDVEIAVDEGYGVTSHETRTVCAQDP